MKPLSKEAIQIMMAELGTMLKNNKASEPDQLFIDLAHTALMAHKFKEALEFYANAKYKYGVNVEEEEMSDRFGCVARKALALWEKE